MADGITNEIGWQSSSGIDRPRRKDGRSATSRAPCRTATVRMASPREFVPHHRDEGVSATCSALSHCLLPLCCAARTPRTPHAALALLPLVPRTHRATKARHQTPRTNDDARRRKDAACPHGHKAEDADRWGKKRKLGVRPGNGAPLRGSLPFSSHASVA